MKKEAWSRSDSCAASAAELEVRKAYPSMSKDSSTAKEGCPFRKDGAAPAPLDAGDGPGGAGVEDGDVHVRGRRLQGAAQPRVLQAVAGQQQALLVGVAGVVEQHLEPVAAPQGGLDPALQLGQALLEVGESGVAQQHDVGRVEPPHLLQHADEVLGVRDRVAQQLAVDAAVVGPRGQHQPPRLARVRGQGQARGGEDGQQGAHQEHGRNPPATRQLRAHGGPGFFRVNRCRRRPPARAPSRPSRDTSPAASFFRTGSRSKRRSPATR